MQNILEIIQSQDYVYPQVLEGCNQREIEQFLQYCQLRFVNKNEHVVHEKSGQTDVFYILNGHLRVLQTTESGKEIHFAQLGPGESFGELAAIDQQPRCAAVLAQTPCTLLRMRGENFRQMLVQLPRVSLHVMEDFASIIRRLDDKVTNLSTLTSRRRIRMLLQEIATKYPINNEMVMLPALPTGENIASQVGCAREVVSREISFLKRVGVINRLRNKGYGIDLAKLSMLE